MFFIDDADKSDEELVTLVLEKGQGYFLNLMKRYEAKLLRYIKRISNLSNEDAEDALQEVFIKVYQNLNDFNVKQKFSSWIYRITHNEVISHYRKLKSKSKDLIIKIDEEIYNNVSSDLDLNKEIDSQMRKESFLKIINTLNRNYREVLILKFFEDKDYKEISFILKKPIGTVGTLINRGKKQLEEKIKLIKY